MDYLRKNLSGELTLGVLVAFNAVILVSAAFFGFSMYLLSKMEGLSAAEKNQTLIDIQQRQIESLTKDISSLRKDLGIEKISAGQTTAELSKKISDTQAQTAQKLSALEVGVNASKTYNTAQIIGEWRPKIAYVECDWKNADGSIYQTQSGSGIVTREKTGYPAVVTNEHVVVDDTGTATSQCRVQVPDYGKIITVGADQISRSSAGYDWARIDLDNSDAHMNSLAGAGFNVCAETPSLGTNIVILGYPGIGSRTDITATEGIISGYDGNFYITSAKVDHGDSGGAAISLQKNCYLGIPTFAKTGGVESLARILDAQFIFPTR